MKLCGDGMGRHNDFKRSQIKRRTFNHVRFKSLPTQVVELPKRPRGCGVMLNLHQAYTVYSVRFDRVENEQAVC